MNKDFHIKLIYKSFSGELNAEEQQQLDNWRSASTDHQKEFARLEKAWELSANYSKNIVVNLDDEFAKLEHRLAGEADQETMITPLKPRRSESSGRLRWLGVAAAILLLAGAFFVFQQIKTPALPLLTMYTQVGEVSEIELSDGTKVWVNENSTFSYPENFDGDLRNVKLEGEAFFDVAKNPLKPFVIETHEAEVKVLGTSFSVRAYDDEPATEVLVKTGKVQIRPNIGKYQPLKLTPNEKGIFNKKTKDYGKVKQKIQNELAWQNKTLTFDNTSVKKAITDIEKYFNIQLKLENKAIENCSFNSIFPQPKLSDVFTALGTLELQPEKIDDHTYLLKGGNCK